MNEPVADAPWDSARYLREVLRAPVYEAAEHTPLQPMRTLSARLGCAVAVKREDLQAVHSFKIRGAYNAMRALGEAERARGVITASAGYPVSYKKGFEITMTPEAAAHTYVAGAKLENGKLLTSGGRVRHHRRGRFSGGRHPGSLPPCKRRAV